MMNEFTHAERAAALALIRLAKQEDLGVRGDVTSLVTLPEQQEARAAIVVRTPGVVAGLPLLELTANEFDAHLHIEIHVNDGCYLPRGCEVATISGPIRALLTVERTALNFLQRLSGIATLTHRFMQEVAGLPVQLLDTRKTTPGWRLMEKYAVRQGGGTNHRIGLYDGILIKDNHLAAFGMGPTAVAAALHAVRKHSASAGLPLEIEVDSIDQLEVALPLLPDIILLDNMNNDQLRTAVARRNQVAPRVRLEASGGVNLTTVRAIAETGVDRISVGALTHSATALDLALDYRER